MTATKSRHTLRQIAAEYLANGASPVAGEFWTHSGKVIEYGPWREEHHLVYRAAEQCKATWYYIVARVENGHDVKPSAYALQLCDVMMALSDLKSLLSEAVSNRDLLEEYVIRQGVPIPEHEAEQAAAGLFIATVHRWALAGTPPERAVAKWLAPRVEHIVRTGTRP
jgi:hypothetical protein